MSYSARSNTHQTKPFFIIPITPFTKSIIITRIQSSLLKNVSNLLYLVILYNSPIFKFSSFLDCLVRP